MNNFTSIEDSYDWLENIALKDEEYFDNFRFCWLDDSNNIEKFNIIEQKGCCGSANFEVLIQNRKARIGCNYGH